MTEESERRMLRKALQEEEKFRGHGDPCAGCSVYYECTENGGYVCHRGDPYFCRRDKTQERRIQ